MFGEVLTDLADELQAVQQNGSCIVGKRFKSALVVAGCGTVFLAVVGPIIVLLSEPNLRVLTLTAWAAIFGSWVLTTFCAIALYIDRRNMRSLKTLRRELAAKNNRDVIAEIRDTRVKQSRHEFKQELLLDRIGANTSTLIGDIDSLYANEVVPELEPIPWHGGELNGAKVLFITSNGSGMGHLSRCLAVAAEAEFAGCRTAILTLSTAYEVVRESGYPVMYHPSSAASPWSISVWNRSFARYLQQRFKDDRPDIVVFDGTAVYRGVTQTCRRLEIPLVWLRRGMWKKDVSRVQYDRPFEVADFVIVPGEVTGEASHDQRDVSYVGPVSQANQTRILDAERAKRALGLDVHKQYALVQVGSAQMDGRSAVTLSIECLNSLSTEVTPVVLVSPIAEDEPNIPGAIVVHGRYPLAPYLKAFDYAVCSAGYNSVHENLAVGLAAVYVPNTAAVTDDQTARAELVARSGMGLVARSESELQVELRKLALTGQQEELEDHIGADRPTDGSEAIVRSLLEIVSKTQVGCLHPSGTSLVAEDRRPTSI